MGTRLPRNDRSLGTDPLRGEHATYRGASDRDVGSLLPRFSARPGPPAPATPEQARSGDIPVADPTRFGDVDVAAPFGRPDPERRGRALDYGGRCMAPSSGSSVACVTFC